jgi:hypothetical protein
MSTTTAVVRRLLLAAVLCSLCGCTAPQLSVTVQLPESFTLTKGDHKHGRR